MVCLILRRLEEATDWIQEAYIYDELGQELGWCGSMKSLGHFLRRNVIGKTFEIERPALDVFGNEILQAEEDRVITTVTSAKGRILAFESKVPD